MEAYLHGDLIQDKELEKTAKRRQKKYREITVSKENKDAYINQGWKLKKEYKRSVKLFKEKEIDELLEDEVWLLFKSMGFKEMNKDRNFKIQAGTIKKQIDVFAKDDSNVFVIECKAQAEEKARSLRKDIHEILNLRKDIIESVRKHYKRKLRISFLLISKNITWSSTDENIAIDNRKNSFFFWKEPELQGYINLTNQLGSSARFQMYTVLFVGKKIPELSNIEIPAIYGGKGKNKYFSFIIQPEKLLKITYVHRREESNPQELSGTYQRMLKKGKLAKICNFINSKHFFPNNIVLNFTEDPIFERKDEVGDIVYGILKFPRYYGSAWVIDGQHRLYGYSETKRKTTDTLPVVAFVKLRNIEQAKLFVEINKEQTPVSSNLLWDLYPDIYHGIEEETYQILRAISLTVKRLNSDTDSPLYKHIYIPSVPKEPRGITNLTIANVCDGLKDNKLLNMEDGLLYKDDYEQTVEVATNIIKAYFKVIANSFTQDWKKGDKGLFRTNIGVRVFLIILRQLLRYLKYEGMEKVYRKKDLSEFENKTKEILGPILDKLKKMSDAERDKIRKGTSKGMVMENAQRLVWDLKEELGFGRELWHKGGWAPGIPSEESDENIRGLLEETEKSLRDFIIIELKRQYGNNWWKQGIPPGVRDQIKEKIDAQMNAEPWRRQELTNLSPERKFKGFVDTPHLKETIKFTINWRSFENVFIKDKEYTIAQFKSFEFVRNKYQHFVEHECDEISKNLGYWGMQWIRRCIGLSKKIGKT